MSDQAPSQTTPVGGWWMASDGKWYPPELHPAAQAVAAPATGTVPGAPATGPAAVPTVEATAPTAPSAPTSVPELAGEPAPATAPGDEAVPHLSRWSDTARVAATVGRTQGATAAGATPQPPDMLQQAMDGSTAAELMSVAQEVGGPAAGVDTTIAPAAPTSGGSEALGIGEFTGASARKRRIRWR